MKGLNSYFKSRILREMLEAAKAGHKSVATQLKEVSRLRFGPTRLSAGEYHWLGLFNSSIYDGADLTQFGGWYVDDWFQKKLNDPRWDAMLTDKFILYALFDKLKIPHPRVFSGFSPFARQNGDLPIFTSKLDLQEYLLHEAKFPLFCKPVKGGSGVGTCRIEAFDSDCQQFLLFDGTHISITELTDLLYDPTGWGFIFQAAVPVHPDLKVLCGNAVTGCRMLVLLHDDGAQPLRAVWKLPMAGYHVDNYLDASTGTLLANIDLETGVATRVVSGVGLSLKVNPNHPITSMSIVGTRVPDWPRLLEETKRAAEAFPGFRFQHWDIGIGAEGPVMYEMGNGWIASLELASGKGIVDEELIAFVEENAGHGTRDRFIGKLSSFD